MTSIRPGEVLLDTEGKRVQAHGGSLFYEDGVYYFYGENKERTDGKSKVWTWGVKCYSSTDLCSWRDEGYLIAPELEDKSSLLHPFHYLDRPHIVKCRATGKYVCWLKFSARKEFCFSVLESDSFLGPYRMVRERYNPYGMASGDFDILQCSDGKDYLYFTDNLKRIIVGCRLSENSTEVAGEYRVYYDGLTVPYCREGVAILEHNGRIFMFTSGMSGYVPNPTQVAELSSPLGELKELGNPHVNDASGASFHSQISDIFSHPERPDVIIALADRWIPSLKFKPGKNKRQMDALGFCCGARVRTNLFDMASLGLLPLNCKRVNTSVADYVWLPVDMTDGTPKIKWKDEWRI